MEGFHDNKPKDDKICIYTHSGGTCQVKNALRNVPKEFRQRVEVVAISPATIIPKELCSRVVHYGTKGDPVVHYAQATNPLHAHEITFIKSAPGAPLFDHSITSPTFVPPIGYEANLFQKKSGEFK